jgi:MFS family permease
LITRSRKCDRILNITYFKLPCNIFLSPCVEIAGVHEAEVDYQRSSSMTPTAADRSETEDPTIIRVADETTPLLTAPQPGVVPHAEGAENGAIAGKPNGHAPGSSPQDEDTNDNAEERQMPYRQVLLLCFCAVSEPTAYFGIFPFINEMIARTGGLKEEDVGFWGGMIESLFSLVEMVLMIFYGRMADRLGRKPVLVWSLTGIGICMALFGMSQHLWTMVLLRCLAGAFGGSVVTVRTMLSENTTKETQGKAFAWYMFSRNLGILIGPIIGTSLPSMRFSVLTLIIVGGGLANPAEQFPGIFGGVWFFEHYPYALATYTTGALVLLSAVVSLLFVKETLVRTDKGKPNSAPPMSTWEVLRYPGVGTVLYIFAHMMLLAFSYTAVQPVFMFTSVKLGGFGFSDQKIALILMLVGISQASWTLLAFPRLQKNFGTGAVLRGCANLWPLFMAAYPFLQEFRRLEWNLAFWIVLPIGTAIGSGVAMAFSKFTSYSLIYPEVVLSLSSQPPYNFALMTSRHRQQSWGLPMLYH